jgi:hypothetical protein
MIPTGEYLRISSIFAVQGRTTEKTFCSRTRRAISCEYCAPKSRTEMARVAAGVHARLPRPWTPRGYIALPVISLFSVVYVFVSESKFQNH